MSFLPGHLRAAFQQARNDDDWYVEPPECVHSLFDAVRFKGAIHDPCCGQGTIPKVAMDRGYFATASDLHDRGYVRSITRDFFADRVRYENIVSNPPYKIGEKFVHHALEFTQHKVAIVMRLSFLAGQKRLASLYRIRPPAEVLILAKRPSMPPGGTDVPAKGGTADYCWIIWSQAHCGPTILRWAP
jgi:hypothetical protein